MAVRGKRPAREVPGDLGVTTQGARSRAGRVDEDSLEVLVERLRKAGRIQVTAIETDAAAVSAKLGGLEASFGCGYLTLAQFDRREL